MKNKTQIYTLKGVNGNTLTLKNISNTYASLEANDFVIFKQTEYSKLKIYYKDKRSKQEKSLLLKMKNCKELDALFNSSIIPEMGFMSQKTINSVLIGKNITKICRYGFANCRNLKEVILPNLLQEIEHYAFTTCNSLTRIELPDSIKSIGYGAFECCPSLKSIRYKGKIYSKPQELNQKLIDDGIATDMVWSKENFDDLLGI